MVVTGLDESRERGARLGCLHCGGSCGEPTPAAKPARAHQGGRQSECQKSHAAERCGFDGVAGESRRNRAANRDGRMRWMDTGAQGAPYFRLLISTGVSVESTTAAAASQQPARCGRKNAAASKLRGRGDWRGRSGNSWRRPASCALAESVSFT